MTAIQFIGRLAVISPNQIKSIKELKFRVRQVHIYWQTLLSLGRYLSFYSELYDVDDLGILTHFILPKFGKEWATHGK